MAAKATAGALKNLIYFIVHDSILLSSSEPKDGDITVMQKKSVLQIEVRLPV